VTYWSDTDTAVPCICQGYGKCLIEFYRCALYDGGSSILNYDDSTQRFTN